MAHPIAQSEADPAKQNQAESNTHEHSGTQRQFRFLALPRRFRLFGVKQSSHTVPPNSRAFPRLRSPPQSISSVGFRRILRLF
jgi:hypothetical protein